MSLHPLRMETISALCKTLQEKCVLLNKEGWEKYQQDQRYRNIEQLPAFFSSSTFFFPLLLFFPFFFLSFFKPMGTRVNWDPSKSKSN